MWIRADLPVAATVAMAAVTTVALAVAETSVVVSYFPVVAGQT